MVSRRPMYCDSQPARVPPLGTTVSDVGTLYEQNIDSRDSATIADDSRDSGVVRAKALRGLQIRGVQILRAVRKEVERGHEHNRVATQDPVPPEHDLRLVEEDLRLVLCRAARRALCRLRAEEDLALREDRAEERGQQAQAGSEPEQSAPTGRRLGNERQVHYGRKEVPDGVTFLEEPAREPTHLHREVLKGG